MRSFVGHVYGFRGIWYDSCVAAFVLSALTILSLTLSTTTQNIERAFLQNNAGLLSRLFSSRTPLNISLPEPILFSDQVSYQQAHFVFENIFASYATFEFYSETQPFPPEEDTYIYKARWSFRDKKNNDQYLFTIFFLMAKEPLEDATGRTAWKIIEIKAKKV